MPWQSNTCTRRRCPGLSRRMAYCSITVEYTFQIQRTPGHESYKANMIIPPPDTQDSGKLWNWSKESSTGLLSTPLWKNSARLVIHALGISPLVINLMDYSGNYLSLTAHGSLYQQTSSENSPCPRPAILELSIMLSWW